MRSFAPAARLPIAIGSAIVVGCGGPGDELPPAPQPVAIATAQAALSAVPALEDFVIYAERSVALREHATVTGGGVGVHDTGNGPFLVQSYAAAVLQHAHVDSAHSILANSLFLAKHSVVGDVQTNYWVDFESAHGSVGPFPSMPPFPAGFSVQPGANALIAAKRSTTNAEPGAYGSVVVEQRAILRLSAGLYQVASVAMKQGARIEVMGPVELRIAGRLDTGEGTYLGFASGTSLSPRDLRVQVQGTNDGGPAARLGTHAEIRSIMLVSNGTLEIGVQNLAYGAFFAQDVDVSQHAQVVYDAHPIGCSDVDCDDENPCTMDRCETWTCAHTPQIGISCSDDDVCHGVDTCDNEGVCQLGVPPTFDDDNPCTLDVCDPEAGILHLPLAAGSVCSDGDSCNGIETCDLLGSCQAGVPPILGDGNPCTIDACNVQMGVTHIPAGAGVSCDDGDLCNGAELCDAVGICLVAAPPILDDDNPCTIDKCDPANGVSHVPLPVGSACSDGNSCNGNEVCSDAGTCLPGTPPALDDANPCTSDSCDPLAGVIHACMPSGFPCVSQGNL